jgi:type II secretory pathway component PulF
LLRCLSAAVEARQPLERTLDELGATYPGWAVRRRVRRAARALRRGTPWQEGLVMGCIIRRREAELLYAAQRAGNLAWALRALAEAKERRAAYRLEMALQVLLPIVVGAIALVAIMLALNVFSPLIRLIEVLSS